MDGLDSGTLAKILAAPAGALLTLVLLRRWHRRRRREIARLVSEGHAEWAAACRVLDGAELLGDALPTPRIAQPSGTLLTAGGRLEWHPDSWSLDAGWMPGSHPLADVRLLGNSSRRDIVCLRVRLLHLEVPGGKATIGIATEAGHPPPQLANPDPG